MSNEQEKGKGNFEWVGIFIIITLIIGLSLMVLNQEAMLKKFENMESHVNQLTEQTNEMYVTWKESQIKTIEWKELNTTCDYIDWDVGIENESLLFFTSPSCGLCIAQEQVLRKLNRNYGLNYTKVCFGMFEEDWDNCEMMGDYLINNSISLRDKYGITGIPALVLNCSKSRLGTMAMVDPDLEYDDLKKSLIEEND